ncbi:MAG: FHA domain-containing protein [Cyanobacteriota bacterium]|nr:FHA domain-containing protein [Cyanobacteriota bacterium]
MATTCPNSKCEYFNRRLPDNVKYCPLCSTPLGNVVPPKPSAPSSSNPKPNPPKPVQAPQNYQPPQNYQQAQQYQPQQNYQPPQNYQQAQQYQQAKSVEKQQNYQTPSSSTQYQPRPPAVPQYNQPTQNIPTLKLIHTSGKEFHFCGEEGFIGRRSANEPNFVPEVDLSVIPHQGVISRRHARVYWDWSQNSYMIVDMSTNGIYLSNNILNPGIPYRLVSGIPMQLGQDALVNFTVIYV